MRTLVILASLLASVADARKLPPNSRAIVLEFVPLSKTKGIDPRTVELAHQLSDQVRSYVRRGTRFRLTLPPLSADEQILLGRECIGKLPACWSSIATERAVDHLFYGTVEKIGDKFQVVVKRQAVTSKDKADAEVVALLRVDDAAKPDLVSLWSKELYAKLLHVPIPQTR